MATIFSHGIVAFTAGKLFPSSVISSKVIVAGIILSMIPDADVLTFYFNIPYEHPLGHRGFTHSVLFAIIAGLFITLLFQRKLKFTRNGFVIVFLYLFLCTFSHGILDAFTSGGKGVGFFIPFENGRYFFGFRPILVSPIGLDNFLSSWGLAVMKSELKFIWIPCILALGILWVSKKIQSQKI
jgi:inner membrane protein